MITCKNWFAFSAGVQLLAASAASGVGMRTVLSSRTIQPGERLVLEIRLPAGPFSQAEEENPVLPIVQDDLLSRNKRLQILDRDYRREKDALVWRYELTSYQVGRVFIPPMEVKLGPETFSTEGTAIEVTSTRARGDNALREEFGPVRPPLRWRWLLKWLAALFLLATSLWLWKRYGAKLKIQRPARPAVPKAPEERPLDWLKRKLESLRQEIEKGLEPRPVDTLTAVLHQFYCRAHGVPADAWTTRELVARLGNATKASELGRVLERCDEFKFSGGVAGSMKDLALNCLKESERILLPCGT
jgi:hypothetical protein